VACWARFSYFPESQEAVGRKNRFFPCFFSSTQAGGVVKTPFFRPEFALFSTRFSTFANFRKLGIPRKSETTPSQPRAKPRFPGGGRNPRFFFAKKHVFCPQEKGPFLGSGKKPEKTGKKCTFLHDSGDLPRTRQNPEFRVSYFCRFWHPSETRVSGCPGTRVPGTPLFACFDHFGLF
jgi:hypothetical protein